MFAEFKKIKLMDVILLLDESKRVTSEEYKLQREFVINVLEKFR